MTANENTGTVFANVRSKLSHFSPSDFFANFGLTKRKTSHEKFSNVDEENLSKNQIVPISFRQNQNGNGSGNGSTSRRGNLRASPPSPILSLKRPSLELKNDTENLIEVSLTPPGVAEEEVDNPYMDDDSMWPEYDERNYADTLELQHFGPIDGLIPIGKRELGIGHQFNVAQLVNATFCDKCGDIIWGLYKQAVKCQSKKFLIF